MNIPILFEDDDILCVDKPAGIETTTGPSGNQSIESLCGQNNIERGGIVHRLDKDTSGVCIIAKTPHAYASLKKQFADHAIIKKYITTVYGATPEKGDIETYIVRDPKRTQAMRALTYPTGLERGIPRLAITHYTKIKGWHHEHSDISLCEVRIETGRTHQIRVHMQSIGHPVLGDAMYFSKTSRELSKKLGIDRQSLHAQELTCIHPTTDETITITSPLPKDLESILTSLSMNNIYILVGPSGAGKDYLLEKLIALQPDLYVIPSYTTRKPRVTEGIRPYQYVTELEFEKACNAGNIIEKVVEHKHLYGTDKHAIDTALKSGKTAITVVEPRGVESFKKIYKERVISIYIDPGPIADLERRIRTDPNRVGQTQKEIKTRIERAKKEVAYKETADFLVSNTDGKQTDALRQLEHIIIDTSQGLTKQ